MRIAILFLAFCGIFVVPFRGSRYCNWSGVVAGPVQTTGEGAPLGIHNDPVFPNQSDGSVGKYYGLLFVPLQSSRKQKPGSGKKLPAAVAVAGGGLEKRTDDEVQMPFQGNPEDEEGCKKRADATLIIVSHRRGRVFVSWTEICEQEVTINFQRFRFKRANPENETLRCKYSDPAFGYGPDEMVSLANCMISVLFGITT